MTKTHFPMKVHADPVDERRAPWLDPEHKPDQALLWPQAVDDLAMRDALESLPGAGQRRARARQAPAVVPSRWKLTLLGSVTLACFAGFLLLILQFDRVSPNERHLLFGGANIRATPTPAASQQPPQDATTANMDLFPPAASLVSPLPPTPALAALSGQAAAAVASRGMPSQSLRQAIVVTPSATPEQQTEPKNPGKKRMEDAAKTASRDQSIASEKTAQRLPAAPSALPAPVNVETSSTPPARPASTAPAMPATLSRPSPATMTPVADAGDPPAPAVRGTPTPIPQDIPRSQVATESDNAVDLPSQAPRGVTDPASMDAPSALSRAPVLGELSRADEAPSRVHGRPSITSTLPLASALQEAARKGRASQLDRLLIRGAPLNAADTAGRTPLMLAVINKHPAMVQRLLGAGANVTLLDHNGLTALEHAHRLRLDRIATLIEQAS